MKIPFDAAIASFPDGRKFITDKKIILDTVNLNLEEEPKESISHQQVERLFTLETTFEFGLTDLTRIAPSGNFWAPGKILLKKQYI